VQMMFLAPRDTAAAIFFEIARRSELAANGIDETASRFERTDVPSDLDALHHALLASLYAARSALDRLGGAAHACELDATSLSRCQTPFTSASSAVAEAYRRYLDTRARIAQ